MGRAAANHPDPPLLSFDAGIPPLPADALYYCWEWDFPDATAELLWPLASNTDRFNFDSGLPLERNAGDDRSLGIPRQQIDVVTRGFRVRITQRPFEWVEPKWFSVYRFFDKGPVVLFRNFVELLPLKAGGTKLRYQSWCGTRGGWLGRVAWDFHMRSVVAPGVDRAFRRYAELAATQGPQASQSLKASPAQGDARLVTGGAERLAHGRSELGRGPDDPALVSQLTELLERGDGFAVSRIRPYELAGLWGTSPRAVLELCLRATRAGLLDLRWDLLCPLCRGAKFTVPALADVQREVHCPACNIDYEVNFERQVELSFRCNSAVRDAPDLLYCVGAPGLTPHIAAQRLLGPGEEQVIQPQLRPGRYRLRLDGQRGGRYLLVSEHEGPPGTGDWTARLDPDRWPDDEPLLARSPRITLRNDTQSPQLVVLEHLAWAEGAVTAAEVTALQLFRDLFSSEALRPGQEIRVGQVVVLFTDLVASTRLYREIGDAPAFGRVMSHFDVLHEELDRHGGAIVKTIGDAILGVFTAPLPALKAMLAVQQRLDSAEQPLLLKAGLHMGPCIAVTLNDRLDYFGTTVNFAARLAHAAHGEEVVLSRAVREEPELADWLLNTADSLCLEEASVELKGFEEDKVAVWRIRRD